MHTKRAYTLTELLVVMSVIAVLMGMGIFALTRFQGSIELQNTYNDISSLVKTLQNKSRNLSVSNAKLKITGDQINSVPYVYAIIFANNNYSTYYCDQSGSNLSCNVEEANVKPKTLSRVQLSMSNINCYGIGFTKATGDMVWIKSDGTFGNTGSCTYTLQHQLTQETKSFTINLTSNSIDI